MNRFILMLPMALAIAACSRDDGMSPELTGNSGAVEMHAGFGGTQVDASPASRATTSPFTEVFDLFLTQTEIPSAIYTLMPGKYNVSQVSAGGNDFTLKDKDNPNKIIYWDDIGGKAAKLTFIGVYPMGSTTDVTIAGKMFDYEVKTSQLGDNFTASDLLISDWVNDYTVSDQKQNTIAKQIVFRHVFSKITFVVSKGNGFAEDETFEPSLTVVHPFLHKGKVTIPASSSGSVSVALTDTEVNSIAPHIDTEAEKLTFDLVMLPGQNILANKPLAEVDLETQSGAPNTYFIKAPSEITLEAGKDYRFNVTLNKTDGQVLSTQIVDWDKVDMPNQSVKIEVEEGTGDNSDKLNNGASFLMKVGGQKTIYTYDEFEGKKEWKTDAPIYWDDIIRDKHLVAEGVLYNKSPLSAPFDPDCIYEGKTADKALTNAVNYIQFTKMIHPFAKVKLVVRTDKNAPDKVNLSEISSIVCHAKMNKFSTLNTTGNYEQFLGISYEEDAATLTYTNPTYSTDGDYNVFEAAPIYIKPDIVPANETLLTVTLTTNANTYKLIRDEQTKFEANKEYTVTLTLSKTEIVEKVVTMEDWVKAETEIGGDAKIDN